LKQVLTQYLDGSGNGAQPANPTGFQGQTDKNGLNDLISELIRVNQPLVQGNGANIGASRIRSGKDRAHSEKTSS